MLVLKTIILLMHANHVLQRHRVTLGVISITIKIFNVAQTVTAKGELIGIDTETSVTNVKCLLPVVGGPRIYRFC